MRLKRCDMTLVSPAKNLTDEEVRRLSWRCRRGLLELDIVLLRFSEQHLVELSANELVAFDDLLDLPDNEFLDVVTGRIAFASHAGFEHANLEFSDQEAMQQVLAKLRNH